ncbi:hypothetical protein D3C87_764820 [compost metagenome]
MTQQQPPRFFKASDLIDGKRYSVYDARAKRDLYFVAKQENGSIMIQFEDENIPPGSYNPVMMFNDDEWRSIAQA